MGLERKKLASRVSTISCAVTFVCIFCILPGTWSQEDNSRPEFLSVTDVITLALAKNVEIEFAGLDRVLEKFAIKKAENAFWPQYSLSASSTIFSKNNLSSKDNRTELKPDLTVSPGIGLKNSLGTQFGLGLPQGVSDKGKYSMRGTFRVSQPLLRGFGRDINLMGLRNTYDAEVINKLKYRNTVSKTIVEIVKKYRGLISNNYQMEASQRSLEESEKSLEFTRAKIRAGKQASADLIQAEAQHEVLQLNYLKQQNAANIAKQNLLIDIGLHPETNIQVPGDIEVSLENIPELEEATLLALSNNFQFRSLQNSIVSSRRSLELAKNNRLWDLSLTYAGGFGGGSFENAIDGKKFNHSLSASLTIPINDYSIREGLMSAQIGLKKAETQLEQGKRDLIAGVKKQLFDLQNLIKQIELAKRSLMLAEKSYEAENKKLEIGKSSSLQVSTAQDKVLSAKKELIDAKINFENSFDDLHVLLGTSTEKWGIELTY